MAKYIMSIILSSFWVHFVLLGLDLVGETVVVCGILLESPSKSESTHRIATRLILAGTAVAFLATIGLFVYDESIAQDQETKIIALENRLAARSLTDAERKSISGALVKFSGQSFVIHTYESDKEAADITDEIRSALKGADWRDQTPTDGFAMATVVAGVSVRIDADAPQDTKDAARALVAALSEQNIAATPRTIANTGAPERLNVTVGIKP